MRESERARERERERERERIVLFLPRGRNKIRQDIEMNEFQRGWTYWTHSE